MNGNSILLRTSLILLASMSCAGHFEEFSGNFGFEVQGLIVHDAWHTTAYPTPQHLNALTVGFTNATGYTYQKDGGSLPNCTLAGRFVTRVKFKDKVSFMAVLGLESGLKDGKGYRPIDPAGDGVSVSLTEWDAQTTTGYVKWASETAFVPALYIGDGSMFFGMVYDARKFKVKGHEPSLGSYLNGYIQETQVLYGFRGEHAYESGGKSLIVSLEFMTNFGKKSDIGPEKYFTNLAKYGTDILFDPGSVISASGIFGSSGGAAAVGTRARVLTVHTNLYKISLGAGLLFGEV